MDTGRGAGLVAGAAVGYAVLMAVNPARPSLRDGLRCLRRYPRVWLLPAALYIPTLPVKWFKAIQIAGLEVLLRALLGALVAAAVLVGLAFYQVANRRPTPKSALSPPPVVRPASDISLTT